MIISLSRPLRNGVGTVYQWFGEKKSDYSIYGMIGHNGLDYPVPVGTPILAAHDGTAIVGNDPSGFGLYVIVDYGKFKTIYAHLSKILVANGETVLGRGVIGRSGDTGNTTGPHLHFGLKVAGMANPGYLNWMDPVPFRDI